jgi:hypothetical protein
MYPFVTQNFQSASVRTLSGFPLLRSLSRTLLVFAVEGFPGISSWPVAGAIVGAIVGTIDFCVMVLDIESEREYNEFTGLMLGFYNTGKILSKFLN